MKRRTLFSAAAALAPLALSTTAHANAAAPVLMGTGDLGVVIERASGAVSIVNTSTCEATGRVQGLGDLSHASVVFSRDEFVRRSQVRGTLPYWAAKEGKPIYDANS